MRVPHKMVFVFGSNELGAHGAGAAKTAIEEHGARWGKCYGHHGNSFAIPTKDERIVTMPLVRINDYVRGFLAYATGHSKLNFQVTQLGCGLAGLKAQDIAPMFKHAPPNCYFDEAWGPILEANFNFNRKYWGTYK